MTISVLESDKQTLENNAYEEREQNTSSWNGRLVVVNSQEPTIILCSNIVSGAIKDYFSSEKRQQNAFDIKLYQHHVRCNSEESKQHLEKAFEKMAIGVVGMVIGVVRFMGNPMSCAFSIFIAGERLWMGVEEFKKAMETRNVSIDNITFVTNAEDLKRNTEELVNHGIIFQPAPFQSSGYQYTDNPNCINPLDTNDYHQPRNFNYSNPGYGNEGKKETQCLPYA